VSIVRLSGGLGNQLFQYSFGKFLEKSTKESTFYDLSEFKYSNERDRRFPEINRLIRANSVNEPRFFHDLIPGRISIFLKNKERRAISKVYGNGLLVERESELVYDKNLSIGPGRYYLGNFISHQYWESERNSILGQIHHDLEYILEESIAINSNSIGMHVRRGDYITNEKTLKFHGYCHDSYFLNAVKHIKSLHSEVKQVNIASDSPKLVLTLKKNIEDLGMQVEFIKNLEPISAMVSLARNRFFVGSNSTFSWWAAALTEKETNIFPDKWFASGDYGFSPTSYFPFPVSTISDALRVT